MQKQINSTIVVIGAGLAGCLICNELARKHNVVLLETGQKNVISYPNTQYLKKQFASVKTFCFGGGGTTNLWHNGLIPILTQDVFSNSFKGIVAGAKAYHNKAAENLFWLDNPYADEYQKMVSETTQLVRKTGSFSDGIDCLLYPKKYNKLETVAEVDDVYSVNNIEFNAVKRKISSVHYCVGDKKHSINVDAVIISAGTLGSPLLVKKIFDALGCSDKTIGKGLVDHPLGFVGKVKIKKKIDKVMKKLSVRDLGNYECRTGIRVKSACGKYTGCAFLRPALTMENKLPIYKFKSLLGASSGIDRLKNMFSWKLFHPDILAEIYSHLFGFNIPGRIYNILFLFEQKRGANSVSYNSSGLEIDWCITKEELEIYSGMITKLHGMLTGISDEVNLETDITDDWLWSAAHHSGTISLGDKKDDLVDKNLKLKACDNVFVCDGSIIQEHSYANTGLTIGSLAMRLVEKISL